MKNNTVVFGLGFVLIAGAVAAILLKSVSSYPSILQKGMQGQEASSTALSTLDQRLIECGAYPNGSSQTIPETSRVFINIPKDIYQDINLDIQGKGATAGQISNGGKPGYAIGGEQKPNCWSYYMEFDGSGTVVIRSKSAIQSIPNYELTFIVSPR